MISITSRLAALLLPLALAAGPLAAPRASAQEAIMLETIGAVRMATPDEVRRLGAPTVPPAARPSPTDTPRRHAAVTE